jgi:hypothetical protein
MRFEGCESRYQISEMETRFVNIKIVPAQDRVRGVHFLLASDEARKLNCYRVAEVARVVSAAGVVAP